MYETEGRQYPARACSGVPPQAAAALRPPHLERQRRWVGRLRAAGEIEDARPQGFEGLHRGAVPGD